VRRFVPAEVERVQGFPEGWTIPAKEGTKLSADKLDSLRYHAVGNSVTPQVAEWVGRRLADVLTARNIDALSAPERRRVSAR